MSEDDNRLPESFGQQNSPHPLRNFPTTNYYNRQNDYQNINACVHKLFNKKFDFKKEVTFTLPEVGNVFTSEPWKIRHLQTLKSGLNFQKSQLNDYPIEEWSAHTAKRNPAGSVRGGLKSRFNPEFLTQAWTKFYECAGSYNIIADDVLDNGRINSLHLCEAPGAFVTSLNHFLKSNYPQLDWQWLATTLNPYHEDNSLLNMICDDRFILCTLDNWYFGEDYSGNLMDKVNALKLVEKAEQMGEIHLVTADGSIDCMLKPDQQEECVASLHYCEVITALLSLAKGGSFVFKLFTIFEHSTINLLYLLVTCFDSVNIFKPATSKEGNSEVYAICSDYCGREIIEPYKDVFLAHFGSDDFHSKAMFPLEFLPKDFLDDVHSCAYYFYKLQCEVINSNISTYEKPHLRNENFLNKYRVVVMHTYFKKYCMTPIDPEDKILKGNWRDDSYVHLNPRNHFGTYSERLHLIPQTVEEKLKKYLNELESIKTVYSLTNVANFRKCITCSLLNTTELNFIHGKPVTQIGSSKFVLSWILKFYNKLLNEFPNVTFNNEIFDYTDGFVSDSNIVELTFEPFLKLESFDVWEKTNFKHLKSNLEQLNEGDSLVLKNYFALTQFGVGVLYILAQTSFEKLCFSSNGQIFFEYFKNNSKTYELFNIIDSEIDRIRDSKDFTETKAILGLCPIQILCDDSFYINLLTYNNVFLYTYSKFILEYLSNDLSKLTIDNEHIIL